MSALPATPPATELPAALDDAERALVDGDAGRALAVFEATLRASAPGTSEWMRATVGAAIAAAREGRATVAAAHRRAVDDGFAKAVAGTQDAAVVDEHVRALLVIADLHSEAGDDDAAERSLRTAATAARGELSQAACAHRLGALCSKRGRFDEAEQHYDAALDLVAAAQGEHDPALGALFDELASVYVRAGRPADAEAALAEAATQLARARPADTALQAQVLLRLGTLKLSDERIPQAMLHFHEAYGLLARLLSADHPLLAVALDKLAAGHLAEGEHDSARTFAERALLVARNAETPSPRVLASAHTTLAAVAFARRDHAGAIAGAAQALAALQDASGVSDAERSALADNLARYRAAR